MENTKFIKVPVEKKPTKDKYYFCIVGDGQSTGLVCHNVMFDNYKGITYYLEEVSDNENELLSLLEDCRVQLEDINKEKERGTTNNLLSRLGTILNIK